AAGPDDVVASGKIEFADGLFDILNGFTQRLVHEVADDGDLPLPLKAIDLVGAARLAEPDEVGELHETGTVGAAQLERDVLQRLLGIAVPGVGTEPDII